MPENDPILLSLISALKDRRDVFHRDPIVCTVSIEKEADNWVWSHTITNHNDMFVVDTSKAHNGLSVIQGQQLVRAYQLVGWFAKDRLAYTERVIKHYSRQGTLGIEERGKFIIAACKKIDYEQLLSHVKHAPVLFYNLGECLWLCISCFCSYLHRPYE